MGLYRAILNSIFGKFSTYIVQFLTLVIYSRLFSPTEFGLVASVQVIYLFLQLLTEMGFGPAIINDKTLKKTDIEAIYGFTLLIGIVGSILFYLCSGMITTFYGNADIKPIVEMVTPAIFFSTLTIVPLTENLKHARFKTIACIDIISEVLSFVIIFLLIKLKIELVLLALKPFLFSMFRYIFYMLSLRIVDGEWIAFKFYFGPVRKIAKFSIYQFSFNVLNFFSRNLDSILVGKYFGSLLLGQYDKAYQLMRYPLMLTTFAITPAIQPILVNFKDDIRFIEKEHNKLAFRLYSISIPITVFILFNAASIVRFLFGQQWELSITYVAILALSIPVQTVMSSSGAFFQVMNKPRLLFITGLITSFLNVLGIGIGVYFSSVELLCKFIVLTFIVNFIITYFILYRYCFCSCIVRFLSGLIKITIIQLIPTYLLITSIKIIDASYELNDLSTLCLNGILLAIFFTPFLFYLIRNIK